MPSSSALIFTLDIDGKPTLAFEARKLREATQLCGEEWLRADLAVLSSNGVPLARKDSCLKARTANDAERAAYREAAQMAKASDDLFLVYLVELDGS
jgi:hypothetical protein